MPKNHDIVLFEATRVREGRYGAPIPLTYQGDRRRAVTDSRSARIISAVCIFRGNATNRIITARQTR